MNIEAANAYMDSFAAVIGGGAPMQAPPDGKLKTGVDLGTANICLAVLDGDNRSLTGEIYPAAVVKDGLVLDYQGAVQIVRELKARAEARLNARITEAAAAVPPGTAGRNAAAVSNVIRAAGIEVINVVEEPSAAASALNLRDGAVVDVGGGTTGVSILRNGRVLASCDEPTGGSHMTLVIAGNRRVPVAEAEKIKLDKANHRELFFIIKPVLEKMAVIVKNFIRDYKVKEICVVGGAAYFDGAEEIFSRECGVRTVKPNHCLLVTPLGIAMRCKREGTRRDA